MHTARMKVRVVGRLVSGFADRPGWVKPGSQTLRIALQEGVNILAHAHLLRGDFAADLGRYFETNF
jgi:hypothetical protein